MTTTDTANTLVTTKTPKGKLGLLIRMLERQGGASIAELSDVTGWQHHSVRGAISGSLKKKFGLTVASTKVDGERRYALTKADQ